MYFSTASPYLENIIVQKTPNSDNILDSEPKISVSGGLPLKMFSKYYGGNPTDKSVDSIIKIGGLSVPIGLVLSPENNDTIRVKYTNETEENTEKGPGEEDEMGGGSPEETPTASDKEKDKVEEDQDKGEYKIEDINDEDMDNLLNMVCKMHKKLFTRKKYNSNE